MPPLGKYLPIGFFVLLAACSGERKADVRSIEIVAAKDAPWRVTYTLEEPVRRIDLGPALGELRAAHWRSETKSARMETTGDRDLLIAAKALDVFELSVEPIAPPMAKNYQAFAAAGDGGVLVYTGHFYPRTEDGRIEIAPLNLSAPEGWRVQVFDNARQQITDWRSEFAEPAFVYFGPDRFDETGDVSILVDPRLPDWVKREVDSFAPQIVAALASRFDADPPVTPQIFVSAGDFSMPGRIAYRGDATPWQFQMTLEGAGWLERTGEALRVLQLGMAHETAHLWQVSAPATDGAPAWIHEGGAEAVATELLNDMRWSAFEVAAHYAEAAEACDHHGGASIASLEASGEWRAVYACGLLINRAAAGAIGPSEFWRRFMSQSAGGYNEATFMAAAEQSIGDDAAARLVRLIERKLPKPGSALMELGDMTVNAPAKAAPAQ